MRNHAVIKVSPTFAQRVKQDPETSLSDRLQLFRGNWIHWHRGRPNHSGGDSIRGLHEVFDCPFLVFAEVFYVFAVLLEVHKRRRMLRGEIQFGRTGKIIPATHVHPAQICGGLISMSHRRRPRATQKTSQRYPACRRDFLDPSANSRLRCNRSTFLSE